MDDHPQFTNVLRAILVGEEGVSVVGSAADGAEAVELTLRFRPDVVLMDISMPVMDGFEATSLILAESAETRVVILSGSNAAEDRARAREAGAVAYVVKDRALEDLSDAIRTAAARRELS
ncbi:MAG TPA: response regulator transcription factor [Gaiellaceae bacterium]|nr:response regulator transcription factor [Gaiellaceae bacterium]